MPLPRPINMYELADQRFEQVLAKIPPVFYLQIVDNLTWMEKIEDKEFFFAASVDQVEDNTLWLCVTVSTAGSGVNPSTGVLNVDISKTYPLQLG